MWGVVPSALWDWAALKAQIKAHGLRNSLLVAPMPTASTAQVRPCVWWQVDSWMWGFRTG